jgi:hypothetical protein
VEIVPVLQMSTVIAERPAVASAAVKVTWGTQATWHYVHFGLKSAPHHRDFRPGKEGPSK